MNNNLTLNLKKRWFDMWKSGEKPEDYRKITKYWAKRLCNNYDRFCTTVFDTPQIETPCFYREICPHFTPRRMTNLELSRWLRDCTEEHREFKNSSNTVFSVYNYFENSANEPVDIDVMIRANDGEWREPLIEIEDYEL